MWRRICFLRGAPLESTAMATLTSSQPLTRKRSWWKIAFKYLGLLILVSILLAFGSFYWLIRKALPKLDGQLQVPSLTAEVNVIRDAHGVPTIEASNLEDLFFAQGYVTAQDRLWQMDIMRRFAAGEVAEILGPDLLAHDREQRILGLRATAHHALSQFPRTRSFVLRGVCTRSQRFHRVTSRSLALRIPCASVLASAMVCRGLRADGRQDGTGSESWSV